MTKQTPTIWALILSLFYLSPFNSKADEIKLVADVWCPYNCEPNSPVPGILIEVAQKAFANTGHHITYVAVPWARAIRMVRAGKAQGIVGTGPAETPDFIYTEKEILTVDHMFFVRRTDPWRYQGLPSLSTRYLGVIRGYSYGGLDIAYIQPNASNRQRMFQIDGTAPLSRLTKLLVRKRVDTIIEDRIVFNYTMNAKPNRQYVKPAGIYAREKIYIAFSPVLDSSPSHANILNKFITNNDGLGVTKIIEKYLK